jgi:prolyl-tRNA editing enzyme YbaK/EbsC (Cys-tRNA(Pro) deacylase)
MKKNVQRVQLALEVGGAECRVLELPAAARSANEAAVAIGCSVAEIVKSRISRCVYSKKPVVVLAAGRNRVDEDLMKSIYVWAAAETPNAIIRIESKLLVESAGGQVFEIRQ